MVSALSLAICQNRGDEGGFRLDLDVMSYEVAPAMMRKASCKEGGRRTGRP